MPEPTAPRCAPLSLPARAASSPAGFAPGFTSPGEFAALKEAAAQGVVVMQSTRVGSGRTFRGTRLRSAGFLTADNLNPQKARILLALALSVTQDLEEIERMFRDY